MDRLLHTKQESTCENSKPGNQMMFKRYQVDIMNKYHSTLKVKHDYVIVSCFIDE